MLQIHGKHAQFDIIRRERLAAEAKSLAKEELSVLWSRLIEEANGRDK
jgi:hypothetical protein